MGALAKYCDECVCVSVCVTGYHRKHTRDLYHFFYRRDSVLLQHGDEILRGGAILGVSSPLAMHCNAFAANNVIQQQKGPFRVSAGVMGVHSAGEV